MSARALALALLLLGAATAAGAETWDPADVAEAKRLQAEETARAAAYRQRVARGDIRAESAPMPREAPQRPDDGGERETLGGFLERLFRRAEERADERANEPWRERERSREELRREQRERQRAERERREADRVREWEERGKEWEEREPDWEERGGDADNWWDEEERRMERAR